MIKENKDFIIIDFTGIIRIIMQKLWIIILLGILGAGIGWGYVQVATSGISDTPMYRSRAKLYVTGNEMVTLSTNAKIVGQSFFADYAELMKSEKVISHVIEDLGLNMTSAQLISCISTRWISDTCMAYVTVTFPDAQLAKNIVDDLVRVTSAYALEIIGMTPPKVYEEATVASAPLSVTGVDVTSYILIGAVGGAAIALCVILVMFFSDKKIRTPEQITNITDLTVYSALLNTKNKNLLKLNQHALMILFEKLYLNHREAKTIAFLNTGKENQEKVIEQYAKYLQEIKKKVVILNTKMYCPVDTVGNDLLEYLEGKIEDISTIVTERNGIDYIACSKSVKNAVEYLDGCAFEQLLKELENRYDYILLITESLEKSAEALIVMKKAGVSLLVAESDKTLYPSLETFVRAYNEERVVSGIVLSNIKGKVKSKRFKKDFGKYFTVK